MTVTRSQHPHGLFGRTLGSFGTSGLLQALNVITGIMLARSLGPASRGTLGVVLVGPQLISSIGGLGIPDAVVFFTARYPALRARIATTAVCVILPQSVLLMLLGFFILPIAIGKDGPGVVGLSLLYLGWIPLNLTATVAAGVLIGRQDFLWFNALRIGLAVATVVGLATLLLSQRMSISNVVLVYLAVNALTSALAMVPLFARGWLARSLEGGLGRKMFVYGVKAHLGNVSGLANERADQALIAIFLAPVALGYYTIAVTFTALINLVGTSIALVALPMISASSQQDGSRHDLGVMVRVTLLLSASMAGVMVVIAPVLVLLLFGSAFAPAVGPARVLFVAAVFLSANRVLGAGLRALERPMQNAYGEVAAVAVTIVSLVILVPTIGIMGAALASLLAYATSFAMQTRQVMRSGRLTLREVVVPTRNDLTRVKARLTAYRLTR